MVIGRIAQDSFLTMLVLNLKKKKKKIRSKQEEIKKHADKTEVMRFCLSSLVKN